MEKIRDALTFLEASVVRVKMVFEAMCLPTMNKQKIAYCCVQVIDFNMILSHSLHLDYLQNLKFAVRLHNLNTKSIFAIEKRIFRN